MRGRVERLRAELKKINASVFLVTNQAKVRYLTGFSGEGVCLVTPGSVYLVTDNRYKEQVEQEARGCRIFAGSYAAEVAKVKQLLKRHKRVYFEIDLFYNEYCLFRGARPEGEFMAVPCSSNDLILRVGLIDKLAAIKDEDEIQKIQRAVKFTEDIFRDYILPQVSPGITEKDLASAISGFGIKYGAEKDAFDIDVASGVHSSLPHATASLRKLEQGDMVQFDFGHVIDGYPSDFSRVVFLGEPTAVQKEIYNIVLTAQEMAIGAAKPGMKCEDLDKVARDYIKSKGYDIPHALGHGLGILLHTAPRVGPGEKTELRPGHVVTIEPGIYIPGWGGIRIEDVIVITENGCRNLTTYPKNLLKV